MIKNGTTFIIGTFIMAMPESYMIQTINKIMTSVSLELKNLVYKTRDLPLSYTC